MMAGSVTDEIPTREPPEAESPPATSDELARQQAITQIHRRRRFQFEVMTSTIVMMLVAVVWAVAEYNNAGGWPTNGFSQSSGIHDVWNLWIIYPFMAWVLYLALRSWAYYRATAISEHAIQREMERQARSH
jgi:H+/Cl- antiporter ClcA